MDDIALQQHHLRSKRRPRPTPLATFHANNMPNVRTGTFIVLDTEEIDTNVWLACCFLTAQYPSGKVLACEEFYVDRTEHKIHDAEKRAFWDQHPQALAYNLRCGAGVSEAIAEKSIVDYVAALRLRTPHFFLVSDNACGDTKIVDGILLKHGCEPLCHRAPDMYAQILDTWTYRQALAHTFGVKSGELFESPIVQHLLQYTITHVPVMDAQDKPMFPTVSDHLKHPPFTGLQHMEPSAPEKPRPLQAMCSHTVFRDCCATLDLFFRCLHLTHMLQHFLKDSMHVLAIQ